MPGASLSESHSSSSTYGVKDALGSVWVHPGGLPPPSDGAPVCDQAPGAGLWEHRGPLPFGATPRATPGPAGGHPVRTHPQARHHARLHCVSTGTHTRMLFICPKSPFTGQHNDPPLAIGSTNMNIPCWLYHHVSFKWAIIDISKCTHLWHHNVVGSINWQAEWTVQLVMSQVGYNRAPLLYYRMYSYVHLSLGCRLPEANWIPTSRKSNCTSWGFALQSS